MLPVQNEIVDFMDDIDGQDFKEIWVKQIVDARNSIFSEMCKELNITSHHHIQECYLNKRSVTKEKLIRWLETVCFILDSHAVPLLQNALPVVVRIDELREEKIEDQSTIIKLQQDLEGKRRNESCEDRRSARDEKLLICGIEKLLNCSVAK